VLIDAMPMLFKMMRSLRENPLSRVSGRTAIGAFGICAGHRGFPGARLVVGASFVDRLDDDGDDDVDDTRRRNCQTLRTGSVADGLQSAHRGQFCHSRSRRFWQPGQIEHGDLSRAEVATLRAYVEALGGQLEVSATFGEQRMRIA
jgi:hypothetical protein